MLKNALLCSVLLTATATPAFAQEARTAETPIVLEAGTYEVQDLVKLAADCLERNFLVNEQEVRNAATGGSTVTLQNRIETDPIGFEDILTNLLYVKGFVIITRDKEKHLYEVISLHGTRAREVFHAQEHKSPEEILARPTLIAPVMTEVELKHVNATIANNALRPFFNTASSHGGGGVTLGTAGNERVIVISGMQNSVANAIRMLRNCDVPGGSPRSMPISKRLQQLEQRLTELEDKIAQLMPPTRRKAKGGK